MLLLQINKLNTKKMLKMEHCHFRLKNYVKQQIFLSHKIQNLAYCAAHTKPLCIHNKMSFSARMADFIV